MNTTTDTIDGSLLVSGAFGIERGAFGIDGCLSTRYVLLGAAGER